MILSPLLFVCDNVKSLIIHEENTQEIISVKESRPCMLYQIYNSNSCLQLECVYPMLQGHSHVVNNTYMYMTAVSPDKYCISCFSSYTNYEWLYAMSKHRVRIRVGIRVGIRLAV